MNADDSNSGAAPRGIPLAPGAAAGTAHRVAVEPGRGDTRKSLPQPDHEKVTAVPGDLAVEALFSSPRLIARHSPPQPRSAHHRHGFSDATPASALPRNQHISPRQSNIQPLIQGGRHHRKPWEEYPRGS